VRAFPDHEEWGPSIGGDSQPKRPTTAEKYSPSPPRLATYFATEFRRQCPGKGLQVSNHAALRGTFARLKRDGIDMHLVQAAIDAFITQVRVGRITLQGPPWKSFLARIDSLVQEQAVAVKDEVAPDPNRNAEALAALRARR
jgi:hypothetical protein